MKKKLSCVLKHDLKTADFWGGELSIKLFTQFYKRQFTGSDNEFWISFYEFFNNQYQFFFLYLLLFLSNQSDCWKHS